MRVRNSINNVIVTAIYYFVMTVTGLILRRVFLNCLGVAYVGLDTVFGNILSFLSLVELGIGPAVTYRLYAPLGVKDYDEVNLLMAVYRYVYHLIALVITVLGLLMIIFLPLIIRDAPVSRVELYTCYILYLSSSIASYLLSYKRSLLLADQKQYVTLYVDIVFNVIVMIIKIVLLRLTHNYILILTINTLRTLCSNIVVSTICDKQYPFLSKRKLIPKSRIISRAKEMVRDVEYILLHKISGYVYSSTDGIVISSFQGVSNVGLLGNYNLIISIVNQLFMQCSSSIQASIGNLVAEAKDNLEAVHAVMDRLNYLYFSILGFFATSLFCLMTPFVRLIFGPEYVIDTSIITLMCINMYVYCFYQPIANLYTTSGLYKEDKITSPIAAVTNLSISILAVRDYGLIGVYIGTIIASMVYVVGRSLIV